MGEESPNRVAETPKVEDKKKVETITIRVKDQSGEITCFRVKMTTKMERIFDAYAARKNIEASAIRFLMDGVRLQRTDTPASLDLKEQDQIDSALEQVGGS